MEDKELKKLEYKIIKLRKELEVEKAEKEYIKSKNELDGYQKRELIMKSIYSIENKIEDINKMIDMLKEII